MRQTVLQISENIALNPSVWKMRLEGDVSAVLRAGQFINLRLDGFFLRRPISVCDLDEGSVTIIYKIVGAGTKAMSEMKAGERLDALAGLGNGYDTSVCGEAPLLIGGGVGIPPLYLLAKELMSENKRVKAILGFNKREEIFYEKEFEKLGAEVIVTTADGSYGTKGFVTVAMKELSYDYVFACGPEPMLRAVCAESKSSGQFSFEERMGCGFGACMGCSCRTRTGFKRICREGPVLFKEDILWDD